MVLALATLAVLLLLGLLIGAVVRCQVLLPGERRRLDLVASQLAAEQRIDALTRATLQAMRTAAQHDRWPRG